jgi:hypothetical protein
MEAIKLWKIIDDKPIEYIHQDQVDYEARLEKWIKNDISIISDNLIVIGTQVQTFYGHIIDILAMNGNGELVIIELKRGKTYREVVAQGIDYATWVKNLTYDEINTIFNKNHSEDLELSEYFSEKFDREIEEYNTDHKILIVGSHIDDSTKRIIQYLSGQPYNVNINALAFNYFKDKDGEYLAQSFILPESTLIEPSTTKNKKKATSIIKSLFESKKLKIGQKLIFKPAREAGKHETDFTATIENDRTNCLKRDRDSQCYSLCKLRRIIANELGLTEVKANWGFGAKYEWITEDGKSLAELNNETE